MGRFISNLVFFFLLYRCARFVNDRHPGVHAGKRPEVYFSLSGESQRTVLLADYHWIHLDCVLHHPTSKSNCLDWKNNSLGDKIITLIIEI